jgi:flagellar biosynthesis protein FliP
LVLSLAAIAPEFPGQDPWQVVFSSGMPSTDGDLLIRIRPFMVRHTDPEIAKRIVGVVEKLAARKINDGKKQPNAANLTLDNLPLSSLAGAFLLSELKEAFEIGFVILLPFFVLDLLILNILLSMNAVQISAQIVALPLKLLLFFAVDGWTLITEKLLGSYL